MAWRLTIAVCGGQECSPEVAAVAEDVGREIARAGAVLVCGGLGGVMEAACRGASTEGGVTVGILPTSDPLDANEWVEYPVPTGIGYARNSIVVGSAHAVIAVDGEFGTLSEIAYAAKMRIPVIGIGSWQLSHPEGIEDPVHAVDNPAKAVSLAVELARRSSRLFSQPPG